MKVVLQIPVRATAIFADFEKEIFFFPIFGGKYKKNHFFWAVFSGQKRETSLKTPKVMQKHSFPSNYRGNYILESVSDVLSSFCVFVPRKMPKKHDFFNIFCKKSEKKIFFFQNQRKWRRLENRFARRLSIWFFLLLFRFYYWFMFFDDKYDFSIFLYFFEKLLWNMFIFGDWTISPVFSLLC